MHHGHTRYSEETALLFHVFAITCCEAIYCMSWAFTGMRHTAAGMQATGPLVEQPLEYFQQVMDTNVTGTVRMTQALVPAMLARVRHPSNKQQLRRLF